MAEDTRSVAVRPRCAPAARSQHARRRPRLPFDGCVAGDVQQSARKRLCRSRVRYMHRLVVLVTATRPAPAGVIDGRKDGNPQDTAVPTLRAPPPPILKLTPAAAPQAMPDPEAEPVARVDSG